MGGSQTVRQLLGTRTYIANGRQTDCKAGVRHPNVRQDVFKPDVFNDPPPQTNAIQRYFGCNLRYY
jgi:hypothetical protein